MTNETIKPKKRLPAHALRLGLVGIFYGLWNPTFIPCACGVLLFRKGCPKETRRRGYRRWAAGFLSFLLAALTVVGLFNYVVDPLWCFEKDLLPSISRVIFNGRQQKTNAVTFGRFRYRTLLVGSSRMNCLNQNDFKGMRAFNYAVNSMVPDEYPEYVRYGKERSGNEFETIILGVDFFGTNGNLKKEFEPPKYYIETSNSFLYRYKMLLSADAFGFSLDTVRQLFRRDKDTFDRFNVRIPVKTTVDERKKIIENQLLWFMLEGYGENYRYDDALKEKLRALRDDNPHSRFIVFTTPVSKPLFCLMVSRNLFPSYERWLRDLVNVFGGFYNFMDLNRVTDDYLHTFSDSHHTTPESATFIVDRILGVRNGNLPEDFGTPVTKENIDEVLARVKARCAQCTDSLPSASGTLPSGK